MYEVSNIFLIPVLLTIILLFIYALFQSGVFATQLLRRRYSRGGGSLGVSEYAKEHNITNSDDLELYAFKKLETIFIATRVAPMLGLVATMIPLGPAFMALSQGNIADVSSNLIVAFSAVIFSLLSASITFVIASLRKGWYASEIREYLKGSEDETFAR